MWWEKISEEGKKYGYFVKPSKSWLVLKDPNKLEEAKQLFQNTPINITTDGKRHLGAAIGSSQSKSDYMDEKVKKWCDEISVLSEIAKSQPHAAYAAFIHGEQHKFTYFLRTIGDIATSLKPLDDIISNTFIPALFGREITENERDIISMPIRDGGLGIRFVANNADLSYDTSITITQHLIGCIITQSDNLPDASTEHSTKAETISKIKTMEHSFKHNKG